VPITRRPAARADAPALVEVYAAYDAIEFGGPEMELADIEALLGLDGSESIVVEDQGIVGFADVARSGEVETLVVPSYNRARDLQRELLAWTVERAGDRGITRLEHWSGTKPDHASSLLAEAGFELARTVWRMHRDLGGELPAPVWPTDVGLRAFALDRDGPEVWNVVMTSFAGTYGSHPRPYDDWVALALGGGYDVVCAVEQGAIIGVATTGPRTGDGHVGQLGVLPEHRGRGIALALLHECFRRNAATGYTATTLTVDGENANARRLYEKAGMRVTKEYRRWERDV
jgi:ribosomal protein S18 acetylase RimI-like enzyme